MITRCLSAFTIGRSNDAGSRVAAVLERIPSTFGVIFAAAAILSGMPITLVFLIAQRYLVSGLSEGAVKG